MIEDIYIPMGTREYSEKNPSIPRKESNLRSSDY